MSMETDFILQLDPESVNSRRETYTSLTDAYKVPLFTDLYEEQCEQRQQVQRTEEELLAGQVFCETRERGDETEILEALFLETTDQPYKGNMSSVETKRPIWTAMIFGILIFGILVLMEILVYRRRKKTYDD